MPILIYGNSRSHLQLICLHQVIELTLNDPKARSLLIVPEQTKMDVEQAYFRLSPTPGLMMADVLSFRRLSWRLLSEMGLQPKNPVDRVGRSMLIHRVLHQKRDQLHTFGHLVDKPGFVSQVGDVLGDLKRYHIDQEQLLDAAGKAKDQALKEKSKDLAEVLHGYEEALTLAGLTDAEDDLTRLSEVLKRLQEWPETDWPWPWSRLSWLKKAHVWVSGFGETRDFTPQEDAILGGLAALTAQLTVTVVADAVPADMYACEQGPDAYRAGRRTAYRLSQMWPSCRIQAEMTPLPEPSRQIQSVLRTGRAGKRAVGEPCSDEKGRLQCVQAASIDDELSWVAGEIRRLVQIEGYRYQDINVAACNLSAVTLRLRAVFREYGIPLFLDAERPLSGTPLMRYILGLLDIGLTGWTRTALMTYLRSGLTGLSSDVIDRLENAWLARGLFHKDRIFDDRLYQAGLLQTIHADPESEIVLDLENEESSTKAPITLENDVNELLRFRDQALLPARQVHSDLAEAESVFQKVSLLNHFLTEQNIPERIGQRVEQLVLAAEMDLAVLLVQSWNALEHILEQLVHISSDLPISLQLFRDTLAAGMDAASRGVIPSAIDQVQVGDLHRSMLRRPKVQFVVGATAADLPPALPPEGLLKDMDRQSLSELTGKRLPSSARDKVFVDAYVLETLFTQATDKLYVTTPDATAARVFHLLAQHQPDCLLILPKGQSLDDARLNAPTPAFRWLLQMKTRSGGKRICPKLEQMLKETGLQFPPRPERSFRVGMTTMSDLYTSPVVLSVSQLEQYAACPFSHLAGRLLSLQRRPEWRPERAETGILLHGILERALVTVHNELKAQVDSLPSLEGFWQRCLQEDWSDQIEFWLREEAEKNRLNRLFDAGLNASVAHRIRGIAKSSLYVLFDQFQKDSYVPVEFEWIFGPEKENALLLPTKERPVLLRGKIDRVDYRTDQDESSHPGFRVVDYKSSRRIVNDDALYHGLSLQLPLYLACYAKTHPDVKAEDAIWFTVNRPILLAKDRKKLKTGTLQQQVKQLQKPVGLQMQPDELQLLCQHAIKKAAQWAEQLLRGEFAAYPLRLPRRTLPCAYCDFSAFCRFDANRDPFHRPVKPPLILHEEERMTARETLLMLLRTENEGDHD